MEKTAFLRNFEWLWNRSTHFLEWLDFLTKKLRLRMIKEGSQNSRKLLHFEYSMTRSKWADTQLIVMLDLVSQGVDDSFRCRFHTRRCHCSASSAVPVFSNCPCHILDASLNQDLPSLGIILYLIWAPQKCPELHDEKPRVAAHLRHPGLLLYWCHRWRQHYPELALQRHRQGHPGRRAGQAWVSSIQARPNLALGTWTYVVAHRQA